MARYFFDVREGSWFAPDDMGMEFPDLEAAEREAAHTAAEIGHHSLPRGEGREVVIDVRDERGELLSTITASLTIKRVRSPSG